MKRYLLVGIATLFVSSNASLKEDFAKMDLDQEALLSDMRKSSALTGEDFDDEEEARVLEDTVASTKQELNVEDKTVTLSESNENEDERIENIRKKATQEVEEKELVVSFSAKKLETIKAEMEAIDTEFEKNKETRLKAQSVTKEAMVKKEKEILAQREAEKREVEAYEKQRAEKIAQESAKKEELEKQQLAQQAHNEKVKKENAMKEEASKKSSTEEEYNDVTIATGVDVNVTRELEEKTKAADEEYRNAVLEMDKED